MTVDPIAIELFAPGEAKGRLLHLEEPLSFWGGVDLTSGAIIDVNHPQRGCSLIDVILVMDQTKGSTAGAGALLELIVSGHGPAGVFTYDPDPAPIAASKTAAMLGHRAMPVGLISKSLRPVLKRFGPGVDGGQFVVQCSKNTLRVMESD
ncbi:MAG: DUF126 domain-containing protein [Pseudomonadota bacterium]